MVVYLIYVVVVTLDVFFFSFHQKTAYEMRIRDGSSDVCSSDLGARRRGNYPVRPARLIPQSRSSYLSRLRLLPDPDHLPALDPAYVHARPAAGLGDDQPPPRILLLYGSLRERSYSRLAVEEAARLLQPFAAETRIFDPADLPLPDQVAGDDHPAVAELRERSEEHTSESSH